MRIRTKIVCCLGMLAPLSALGQTIYVCKDVAGNTHTSDRPVPECHNRAMREMDRNGIVRRHIEAPLSAEQQRLKKLDEEKRRADEAAAAEEKQHDRTLLARFATENDLLLARQRNVALVQDRKTLELSALAAQEGKQKQAQAEMAVLKNPKEVPQQLRQRLMETEQGVVAGRKKIAEFDTEIGLIEARFDVMTRRYRQLKPETASR